MFHSFNHLLPIFININHAKEIFFNISQWWRSNLRIIRYMIFHRNDRPGRLLLHLLDIVIGLRDGGTAFCSLTEGMDTNTPHWGLLFQFFGALAKHERALTRERIQA